MVNNLHKAENLAATTTLLTPTTQFDGPFKINVHFELPERLCDLTIDANASIRRIVTSEIDFSAQSLHKPHMTLAMGYCETELVFWKLLEFVDTFCKIHPPIETTFGKPYLKAPKRTYAFVDPDSSIDILHYKKELDKTIKALLQPLEWDVVSEPPHVTLAYIKSRHDEIEAFLLGIDVSGT